MVLQNNNNTTQDKKIVKGKKEGIYVNKVTEGTSTVYMSILQAEKNKGEKKPLSIMKREYE